MQHTVTHFGSQAATINSQGAEHYSSYLSQVEDPNLAKKVCAIHYDDLIKLEDPSSLLKALEKKVTGGLVIILLDSDRAHGGYKGSLAEQDRFHVFSDALAAQLIAYPVYFTYETDELLVWYDLLTKKDARLDEISLQVKPTTQRTKLTEQMQLDVFYSVEQTTNPEGKPIIAISASYDSLGAAPSLPLGSESSLSSVLSVLYMSRVMSRQFNQVKQRFDLMFILTPGASFGYEPSQRFIDYLQNSIKQKISLIVCLDQLVDSTLSEGTVQSLYLHDS